MDTIFFSGLSQDLKCKSSIYFKNEDIFFKKVSFERIVEHGSVFSLLIFAVFASKLLAIFRYMEFLRAIS